MPRRRKKSFRYQIYSTTWWCICWTGPKWETHLLFREWNNILWLLSTLRNRKMVVGKILIIEMSENKWKWTQNERKILLKKHWASAAQNAPPQNPLVRKCHAYRVIIDFRHSFIKHKSDQWLKNSLFRSLFSLKFWKIFWIFEIFKVSKISSLKT